MRGVDICLTPLLFPLHEKDGVITVVVDILRATTSICEAFKNGVDKIIPVVSKAEAEEMKNQGYFVASERAGEKLPFADIGNSPYEFTRERIGGKTVVYSTTNGTATLHLVSKRAKQVLVGAFANLTALTDYLTQQDVSVLIVCAGYQQAFNLEDTIFAGALAQKLLARGFFSEGDSVKGAIDLWSVASQDLTVYIQQLNHAKRLSSKGLSSNLDFCFEIDTTDTIPFFDKFKGILQCLT